MVSQSGSGTATFSCPICLGENQPYDAAVTGDGGSDDKDRTCPNDSVFELSSCRHQFCASCLRAYVRSKLMDGVFAVPCCHFKMSALDDDFRPCDVVIPEGDIYRLVHMEVDCEDDDEPSSKSNSAGDDDEGKRDESCRSSSSRGGGGGRRGRKADGNELWTKYQKLKFDAHHGKECVRRCPKCDEARLFDEESMRRYQAKCLTRPNDAGPANDGNNASTGSGNLFERALSIFRRRRRSATEATPGAAAAPNRNVSSHNPSLEEERNNNIEENENSKEDDGKSIEGDNSQSEVEMPCTNANEELSKGENPTTLSPVNDDEESSNSQLSKAQDGESSMPIYDEEEARAPQDGGSGDDSADDGPSEAGALPERTPFCPVAPPARETKGDKSHQSLVKSTNPIVACLACDAEFCYFHSNAHSPGGSCVEYHRRNLDADRTNADYARRVLRAKPCPSCGISVSKDGGCNQIKCGGCGTHFCWLCGTVVDDGAFPEHFRWWNLRGCANMQLDENDEPLRCTIWGARALSALQILVLGVPSLALTIVSMLLCPCLVPGCGRTNRERVVNCVSFWGSFMSSLLLLPFTCLGMLLLTALYCFLAGAAFAVKVFTTPSGRQGGASSSDGASAAAGGSAGATEAAASDAGNAASNEAFMRELESIFDRIEEGRSTSNAP